MKSCFLLVFWPTVSLSCSYEEHRLKQNPTTGSSTPALTRKPSSQILPQGKAQRGFSRRNPRVVWDVPVSSRIYLRETATLSSQAMMASMTGSRTGWHRLCLLPAELCERRWAFHTAHYSYQRELTEACLPNCYTDFIKHASAGSEFYSLSLKCLMAFMIIKIICFQHN